MSSGRLRNRVESFFEVALRVDGFRAVLECYPIIAFHWLVRRTRQSSARADLTAAIERQVDSRPERSIFDGNYPECLDLKRPMAKLRHQSPVAELPEGVPLPLGGGGGAVETF